MNKDIQHEIREIIDKIERISANGDYIYRGEPIRYRKVTSTLYRQYAKEIAAENFNLEIVQDEMLAEIKSYVYGNDKLETLTQLQHFGGNTNLIDFTTDYLIALFFACNGHHNKHGRIILLDTTNVTEIEIVKPPSHINRVRDQKSVFAQPSKGFIEPEQYKKITISKHLKQPILNRLEKYHGISAQVIYNDLHGFIKVQSLHQSAYTEFYKGFSCLDRGDEATTSAEKQKWYEEAVKYFNQPSVIGRY